MKKVVLFIALAVTVLFGHCTVAYAHQQKAALTSVKLNSHTNQFEVVHRFSLHDAEHAVKRIFTKDADIYGSSTTQANFAEYVYQHFSIALDNGESVSLKPIGYELDGKHFWIYQEMAIPSSPNWLVQHSALQEIWSSQTNTVNIEIKGAIKTLVLNKEAPAQRVRLKARAAE